jgi:hypothetical protein
MQARMSGRDDVQEVPERVNVCSVSHRAKYVNPILGSPERTLWREGRGHKAFLVTSYYWLLVL